MKVPIKIKFLIPLFILIFLLVLSLNILYNYFSKENEIKIAENTVVAFKYMQSHINEDNNNILNPERLNDSGIKKFANELEKVTNFPLVVLCSKEQYIKLKGTAGVNQLKTQNKWVILNRIQLKNKTQFIKTFKRELSEIGSKKLIVFNYSESDRNYNCVLFMNRFNSQLNLPVVLINENLNYVTRSLMAKFIFVGSASLGLIIFLIFIIITRNIESDLKEREADLAESNIELENFAYVASHDLKAPLRAIENLADWIEEDLEEVNDNTKQQLGLLKGRVNRMNALLDSLLEYSRIGRIKEENVEVDISKLLDNILNSITRPDEFEINIITEMPVVKTQLTALNQVFRNLITNSIKHHDKNDGHITIGCDDDSKYYRFYVKDDGPGIPKDFHEKVFLMFQTLKSKDEVEGVGMGLAIIKKNIDKIGGMFQLKSDTGKGTDFVFYWPKK